jgi:AraC family transcriptional regulator
MFDTNPAVVADALTALTITDRPDSLSRIVGDETAWRALPADRTADASSTRVIATRWRSLDHRTKEVKAETPGDSHLVAIVLRNEDVKFSLAGRTVHDGTAVAGTLQVTEPGIPASCVFRGPYDVLHLHVPNRLIAEFGRAISGAEPSILHATARLTQDPVTERLGRALLASEETGNPFGRLYADCISTAIVARLLGPSCRTVSGARPKVAELARWRLRRVTEYVEANLGEPMSLADLAETAGLTRMHFAAQFRAATGLPPHEYLLRRRIERAQEMLVEDKTPLVEVALTVGFQTQAHFTSVFKRFTGQPPRAWRQSLAAEAACAVARSARQPERQVFQAAA